MPRRSSSPSLPEKKIPIVPITINSHSHSHSQRPSFLQTMKEGIALGVGSSIGHRIVSAAFGEPTLRVSAAFGEPTLRVSAVSGEPTLRVGMMTSQAEKPLPTVKGHVQEYEQCMKEYDDKLVCAAKYLS